MLKPFYQGKLDTFCAMYAVLNALKLTYGIRTLKAREILNDTLLNLAINISDFKAVLNQDTDYINLVDRMFLAISERMPLIIEKPYKNLIIPTPEDLYDIFKSWLGYNDKKIQSRAIVFRFIRHISPNSPALNKHWTTIDYLYNDMIHLFDCSHEAEAILNIKNNSFVTNHDRIDETHLLYIQPESIRMIKLPE